MTTLYYMNMHDQNVLTDIFKQYTKDYFAAMKWKVTTEKLKSSRLSYIVG